MVYNKNRLALLAGIDNRDQYFGKTLAESSLWEAEDDLDAVEDEEEAPLEAEEGEEGEEESIPKEDVVDALAPILGVDAEELSALVSGEEGGDEEAEEGGDEEDAGDELELENDVLVVDNSEEAEVEIYETRLRRAIRGEIRNVINEVLLEKEMKQIAAGRRTKSVAAAMGYRPAFTPTRAKQDTQFHRSTGLRLGKGFKK